jgi:hypothetical protein
MTIERITELQAANGLTEMQNMINSGEAWRMEGSYGRAAMDNLESGACYLPQERHNDFYGNTVPSRDDLKSGTKGTLENSINFWERFENGDFDI